jgi:predicted AAA+ superfamily ATPase
MLAHHHGQVLNLSGLGRSLGISDNSVRSYVDVLAGTFVVRVLPPWFENVAKRQVKRPKAYITDPGLLHALLGLETMVDLERHPILGASWEGFALGEVIRRLGARTQECFFWGTHAGAELDLLVVRGNRRLGFEFKRSETPRTTRAMHSARTTLKLDRLDVVHAGSHTFPLGDDTRALSLHRLLADLAPLSEQ